KRLAFILARPQCSAFRWDSVEAAVARREAEAPAVRRLAEDRADAARQRIQTWCKAVRIRRPNRGNPRALRASANFILIPTCARIPPRQFRRKRCGRA